MKMRVVEIKSRKEIVSHFDFIHPNFTTKYQKISFSDDRKLMMEKFDRTEIFLYSRVDVAP